MITLSNNKYIESQNIRVFPCAYRGYYEVVGKEIVDGEERDKIETLVFDPEARATTEANFTNTFHKVSGNKESYVIAWAPDSSAAVDGTGTLKCVIGGYYFEIYNHKISNFFDTSGSGDPYYLCIKTEPISLGTSEPDENDARTTEILSSFANSTTYLDVKDGTQNKYAFTGLLISTTDTGTASLVPFKQGADFFKLASAPAEKIGTYYSTGDQDTLILIESDEDLEDLPDYAQFYVKSETYKINPAALPVTGLLDVGGGEYSLRMIEDITEQGTNTTVASGDYSVALGRSTAATGEASIALGNNTEAKAKGAFTAGNDTEASGEGAFAAGNNTVASGRGAVALGNDTKAVSNGAVALGTGITAGKVVVTEEEGEDPVAQILANNQVVIGQYNAEDTDQAFIIANGTATTKSNKFTVSYDGDVKTLGTLEVKGSIKATASSNNDLELGTSTEGSSGSIKVYGETEAETPVFSVENSGNTTITGTTTISGNTSIAGLTHITKETQSNSVTSGALKVAGGVGIVKNLNVGGATAIHGNVEIGKTEGAQPTTTLKGALITHGATTLNDALTVAKSANFEDTLTVTKCASFSGGVTITGKATSSQTSNGDAATTLTTKGYVDKRHTEAKNYTDESIGGLDYSDPEEATTSTGKYVQSILQENGKIAVKVRGFETSVNKDVDSNAPTSKAVSTFVNESINTSLSNLWKSNYVTNPSNINEKATLKDIILNAAYPVGSIYTYYSQSTVTECPIAKSLGGTWEAIEGKFLCGAESTHGSLYYRDTQGGYEETQLKEHYHELARNADNLTTTKVTSVSAGNHYHTTSITARAHDASTDTGLRSGNPNGGCHQWTFYYDTDTKGAHTHSIDLTDIKTAPTGVNIEDTPGTNLPPYLAVYMWKRTA